MIKKYTSIELFAGGGGMALGSKLAGLSSVVALEFEKNSCETLRRNKSLLMSDCKSQILEMDVKQFEPEGVSADILLGGPPCQPFSIGGKKAGNLDSRDLFPDYLRILHATRPKAFIIENVKGLTSPRFSDYLEWVLLSLEFASEAEKIGTKNFNQQLKILRKMHKTFDTDKCYDVSHKVINAVDYGVPQSRQRVFIVGIRSDLKKNWIWPEPTHSLEALIYSKYVTGEYFERHKVTPDKLSDKINRKIQSLKDIGNVDLKPVVTTRDALVGLPEPKEGREHRDFKNHIGIPGARIYPGHTGSYIDDPSKTLKAGVHGCPGGENMIRYRDGSVRYFSVRESARIQTFPDDYFFYGARSEAMRQIGNAVPVRLAEILCSTLRDTLNSGKKVKHKKQVKCSEQVGLQI